MNQDTTPLADALAGVDATMGTEGNPYGDPQREVAALRDLADAVRLFLLAQPGPVKWRTANNGAGARMWFLIRTDETVPVEERYHYGSDGQLIRYASSAAAQRAADKLNREARKPGLPEKAEPEKVYDGYTREQLSAAFDLVKNPENWKLPIAATVPLDADRAVISAAVTFFTGSTAEFIPGRRGLHVGAAGYYAAIGS